MTGGSFERHPLSYYFFDAMRTFIFLFTDHKTDFRFRAALAFFSNITISLSLVTVYKYLRNIVVLPSFYALMIVVFYSLFSTNILLSFTPETYTYTLFLLLLFMYYSAVALAQKEKISGSALTLFSTFVGGLTITNIVKIFVPVLFEKNLFRNWKKFGNALLRITVAVAVFALLFLNRIQFKYENILSKSNAQYEKFSSAEPAPVWDMILSYFFGGNMLFSSFFLREKHNMKGFYFQAIFMEPYSAVLPYLFVAIMLGLLVWAYFRNFKNRFVQIIMLSFAVDFAIHALGRFGLHTAYIYGGHFIYIFPLMLGWLLHSARFFPKILSALLLVIFLLMIFLLINNFHRMLEFFAFLEEFYQ